MNEARLSGRDLAAALGVIVIWGLNFVAMKFALHDFTPFQLGAARYLLAVLPLVFFVRSPKLQDLSRASTLEFIENTPAEFADYVRRDRDNAGKVFRSMGVRPAAAPP